MIRSIFLALVLLTLQSNLATAHVAQEYLPDLISPEELGEEFGLPAPQSLINEEGFAPMGISNGGFTPFGIEEWSSANGIDLTQYFKVVVVVNKANKGPTAQRAQVYFEGKLYATYKISTGRETPEKSPSGKVYRSITPLGWFKPLIFSPNHYSRTWQAPMPWAVFFNGGIALHATTKAHYPELGKRASGGCVRFRYENAKTVYGLIKEAGKAMVPKFNRAGKIQRDENGEIILEENYDTLIIVENTQK